MPSPGGMKMRRFTVGALVVGLAVIPGPAVVAEDAGKDHAEHAEASHHRHLVSGFVGATHEHGEDAFTFGAEYIFDVVPERIGVGGLVERAKGHLDADLALALVHYRPVGGLYLSGGAGIERKKGERETVGRIGVGYDFEFGRWVVAPEINVDFIDREEAIVYGVAIGRKF